MTDALEFEIRGRRKIIAHYRELLDHPFGLSVKLTNELVVKLVEEERQLEMILRKQKGGRY